MENMIFLNIGNMKCYKGITKDDKISNGGSNADKCHERFNFKPHKGYMYGFVQPAGGSSRININKIGELKQKDSIDNILVVWTSKEPVKGPCVTGWYKNATVYRDIQTVEGADREYNNERIDCYLVKAKEENCVLLKPNDRFEIERKGRTVWYAKEESDNETKRKVINFIKDYESKNVDSFHKNCIEKTDGIN